MKLSDEKRQIIKEELIQSLRMDSEIQRVVVFGSFLNSNQPNDIDIAIFQTSEEKYLPLAMKYRGRLDHLASEIALDVIPIKADAKPNALLEEIAKGEILYER